MWLLRSFSIHKRNDPLRGDLFEEYNRGRPALWFWWQTSIAILRTPTISRCQAAKKSSPLVAFVIATVAYPMVLILIAVMSSAYVAPLPLNASLEPLPPPAPPPPTILTDTRVFGSMDSSYSWIYSSLPRSASGIYVAEGVGIHFLPLPDTGGLDKSRNPPRRVWPGQALEDDIVRRVIPEYPQGARSRQLTTVALEYVIRTDGSVKVLRASGPRIFVDSARSAIEAWRYRPMTFQNSPIEVVSRIEVGFDGELANAVN